ncbi:MULTISPECIES: DNA-binding response regulator [unclassified Calothrix]|uniref:DNA-binding response regulator n=1 Tax=unclassified Calothrix TaxID=2619626 RepID=UPI001F54FFD0|nr:MULTISPECIES: DNA-binding response regulator [unclassified Calothrix]
MVYFPEAFIPMNQCLAKKVSLQILLVDSYDIALNATAQLVKTQYPDGNIISTRTANDAINKIVNWQPDLIIMDIYLPEKLGEIAQTKTGLDFLQQVMQKYPKLNIFVQSPYVKRLVQIKPAIDKHQGGFVIADKNITSQEMLSIIDGALKGFTRIKGITDIYIYPDIYEKFNLKPEILKLLSLAFNEGLQDKAIAAHICVSERTVRKHWETLQAALGIDCHELRNQGINIRIFTKIRARAAGLID